MSDINNRDKDRENINEIFEQYSKLEKNTKENFDFYSKERYKYGLFKKIYETDLPDQQDLKPYFDPLSSQFQFVKNTLPQIPVYDIKNITASLASTSDFSMATMNLTSIDHSSKLGNLIFVLKDEVSGQHNARKDKIKNFLHQIDLNLEKLYIDAWETFFVSKSKRVALSFMREALKQLIFKLTTEKIEDRDAWEKRIKNIAENYSKTADSKQLLINAAKTFGPTIHKLSKFKSKDLSEEKVEAILYQTDSLMEILVENVKMS